MVRIYRQCEQRFQSKVLIDTNAYLNIATMNILQYHPYFKFVDLMKNYH